MHNILLSILLLLSAVTSLAQTVEMKKYTDPEIVIHYEPRLENAAAKIANAYPEIKTVIEKKIGWTAEFVPTVVLMSQRATFQKMARNSIFTAFAIPENNVIVMDYSKLDRTPVDLQETFEHELYHLLMHHHIEHANLPRWLDEGFAQWASGGIADIINPENIDALKHAVLSENLIPLKDLHSAFPRQSGKLILAYQESRSFVEFIAHEYGDRSFLAVLNDLKNGKSIEEAISDKLLIDLQKLEEKWHKNLVTRYTWMTYVSEHIYWFLFFAAALITLIGYLRFRIRLRNYRDEDDIMDVEGKDH
jgi:hypothetical protein